MQLVHGDLLELIGRVGHGRCQFRGVGEILGHADAPGFEIGQRFVADLHQVRLAHEEVPAVAKMGLLGIDEITLPLCLVGVGHHQIAGAGFGIAGEAGAGVGQLDPKGRLQLVEDGGDYVYIESAGFLIGIEILERGLHGAADHQLFGGQSEWKQQPKQGDHTQTTSPEPV